MTPRVQLDQAQAGIAIQIKRGYRCDGLRRPAAGLWLAGMAVLLSCTGCHSTAPQDAHRQLEQCQLISHTGDELTRCLVVTHDWGADSARQAGVAFQARLDSIQLVIQARDAALQRAAAAVAAQQRRQEGQELTTWAHCVVVNADRGGDTVERYADACDPQYKRGVYRRGVGTVDLYYDYFPEHPELTDAQRVALSKAWSREAVRHPHSP